MSPRVPKKAQITQERVEYNIFLFDKPLKGSKSLKIFKISLTFRFDKYDPQTDQWSCDVAPTTSCRTSVGVAVLDNLLYAVGGQDGVQCLNHVERYDPKENKWTKVAPMTTRRLGVAVAVLGGYLYAIGGSDGQSPLNTVERYDPRHNKWALVSPMSTRRKHLGCAVFNNLIYAVGGRDDCMELSSAERYNPHTNTWSPIVAMTSRRSG
ncbi:hypothetical protein MTP99_009145, partial [Tenebrio molitor]